MQIRQMLHYWGILHYISSFKHIPFHKCRLFPLSIKVNGKPFLHNVLGRSFTIYPSYTLSSLLDGVLVILLLAYSGYVQIFYKIVVIPL